MISFTSSIRDKPNMDFYQHDVSVVVYLNLIKEKEGEVYVGDVVNLKVDLITRT